MMMMWCFQRFLAGKIFETDGMTGGFCALHLLTTVLTSTLVWKEVLVGYSDVKKVALLITDNSCSSLRPERKLTPQRIFSDPRT